MNKEGQLKEQGRKLMRQLNIRCKDDIPTVLEKLKQQLQAKLRRYEKGQKFFIRIKHTNKMPKRFTEN